MDHIVYLDARAGELEKILAGEKTMIIRGATGRKLPHGRVFVNDRLYFVNNNGEGVIKARGKVKSALHSEKMDKSTSEKLVEENMEKLRLTTQQTKRWAGKRYLVLIELENIEPLEPFSFSKTEFSNMDDWLPVGDIEKVKH